MVLSKAQIKAALEKGELVIEPFDDNKLTPNGYLLTVDRVTVPSLHWTVKTGFVAVSKQTAFQIVTREYIKLGQDLTATLTLSAQMSNRGVLASFPRLDAGFDGKVQISAYNSSVRTLDIDTGDPIAELVLDWITVPVAEAVSEYQVTPTKRTKSMIAPLAASTEEAPLGTRLDPRDGGTPCLSHNCTACCHETEMPLTNEDKKRLEDLGYTDFFIEDDDWFTMKNIDGKCAFLQKDYTCKVYKNKPTGCRFYPVVWSMDTKGPVMDLDCPHSNEFFITDTLAKDLKNLVDTVQRERKQRRFRKGAL
jgi:deoxycytidine triphosphate deaminase/Fe-S-cluster containining protein